MMRHLCLALAIACTSSCQGKGASGGEPHNDTHAVGVEFGGKTSEGKDLSLADYRGKVVLVNIWATWCKPCVMELPELQKLHHAHGDDFVVVGVNVDKPRLHPKMHSMIAQHGIDYPVVLDPDGQAVGTFGVNGYPTSVLIDRNGVVRWRREGIIAPGDAEADTAIKAALAAG
ncbi:MAG: TlpA family protein disulfide reductase [Nannocystaceae bacterium]|nr:TlpA family protein disulfide reductase [Nannocystaceae bacterium]